MKSVKDCHCSAKDCLAKHLQISREALDKKLHKARRRVALSGFQGKSGRTQKQKTANAAQKIALSKAPKKKPGKPYGKRKA